MAYEVFILNVPVALFKAFSLVQLPYFETRLALLYCVYTMTATLLLSLFVFFGFSLPLRVVLKKYFDRPLVNLGLLGRGEKKGKEGMEFAEELEKEEEL